MPKWSGMWTGYVHLPDARSIQICSETVKWKTEKKLANYIASMTRNGINTTTWKPYVCRNMRHAYD